MKRPTVTLRDLFWLILVIGISLGWWLDQDRIRLEYKALQEVVQRLNALSVSSAEQKLAVDHAEFAQAMEINQKTANCISPREFQLIKLRLNDAQADLEKALAVREYGAAQK